MGCSNLFYMAMTSQKRPYTISYPKKLKKKKPDRVDNRGIDNILLKINIKKKQVSSLK